MKLAAYTLAVSVAYALLAVMAPEAARALVLLFIGLLIVPAIIEEAGRALGKRTDRRPHA